MDIDRMWEGFMFWCECGSYFGPEYCDAIGKSFPGMVMWELPNMLLELEDK